MTGTDQAITGTLKVYLEALEIQWNAFGLEPALGKQLGDVVRHLPSTKATDLPQRGFSPTGILELVDAARSSIPLSLCPADIAHSISTVLEAIADIASVGVRRPLRKNMHGLYVIIDPQVTAGRDPVDVAQAALRGGAKVLQLRDKTREKGYMLHLARALVAACHQHNAMLIVNDHADVARLVQADGLHVGQEDLPVAAARSLLSPHQLIGRSNPTPQHAIDSEAQGADHVAIGPIYATGTKDTGRPPVGTTPIATIKSQVSVPVVAIGGINHENVGVVVQAGADAVCVSSAVGLAADPEEAAKRLVQAMARAGS